MENLKLQKNDYYFDLPEELIAQTPIENRSDSRLLVFDKTENKTVHDHFFNLKNYLKKGDVLVLNEAKVAPVRLIGTKKNGTAKCEVLLINRIDKFTWEALVKPAKRLKEGTEIVFGEKLSCTVGKNTDFAGKVVTFKFEGVFEEILNEIGEMPLPHYIKTKLTDKERYNTVYAKNLGSAAAPTAGLHFTSKLLEELEEKGIIIKKVLLNVSIGTFRPVKVDNIKEHQMHSETYVIPQDTADAINKAKSEGRRVICVGTTSVRTLEANASKYNKTVSESSSTDIFIHNNYEFKVADVIITNFHLPESTLCMLVAAFIGYDNFKKVYKTAIEEKYRFFSFGDACLFINKK